MRRILSFLLLLVLLLTPCISLACTDNMKINNAPIPSITTDGLYYVSGQADIFRTSNTDYLLTISSFSDDIVDCIPLFLYPSENSRHVFFTLTYPIPEMEYDCFIIDNECNLIGNVTYNYLLCTCGEWWYDINIVLAPNKYELDQIVYLIWVE